MSQTPDFDAFYAEWDEDQIMPNVCIGSTPEGVPCGGEMEYADELGQPWCAACQYRGEFINWGLIHDWPALESGNFAIAEGQTYWMLTASLGTAERVLALMAAMENYERRTA